MTLSILDLSSLLCFFTCWIGYTRFARNRAKTTNCLSRCLHQHRIHWMNEVITKELRVGEASLMANLERHIAFFASTTLLIIAGVLTLFAQVEMLEGVILTIPFSDVANHSVTHLKLSLIVFIFVLSFFQFTWSMRQYGFLNVMIGAAPIDKSGTNKNLSAYAKQMATVQDQASHSYNYGLRSYYFSIAAMCWFYHPALFIIASLLVVYTLYNREFNSKAVKAVTVAQECLNQERQERYGDKLS